MFQKKKQIVIHSEREFEGMRAAGRLAAECLDFITPHVRPGVSTEEINRLCHDFQVERGATPAPLGYRGFPKSICTSVNEVICHGIPAPEHKLRDGDIINIDVTPILEGWHGDSSRMYLVGEVSEEARRIVDCSYRCLMAGIAAVKPGAKTRDIGVAIQEIAEAEGFSVVREFCGHGLGREFHSEPQVNHYDDGRPGTTLRKGMFFTIEPMINAGHWRSNILADDWTAVTIDKRLSAQFEHSIGVTDDGCEIFTTSPMGYTCPPYR
ncbi:MAG: type I methionyl aminopeptidase [Planctomycetes bacterium]|nr:type I methionyl aminopeptidase [Planctomycetota bacterium]